MDCCENDKFHPNFKHNCICSFCKEPMVACPSYRCKKCRDLKVISTPLKDTQSSTKETPKTTTKRINLVPKILVTPIKITKRTINIMPLVVVKKLDIPSAILNPYGMVNDKMTRRQGGQDDMGDKATRVTRDVDQLITRPTNHITVLAGKVVNGRVRLLTIAMAVSARSYCYGCGNEKGRYTHLRIHVYMS